MSAGSAANRSESGANTFKPRSIAASGAPPSCRAGSFYRLRRIVVRFTGSVRMRSISNCSSIRRQACTP